MEHKKLDMEGDGTQSRYQLTSYPAPLLPLQYRNLILKNFLVTLRSGNKYFQLIDKQAYFENYDRYIKHLLLRPANLVTLALLIDDLDIALGWSMTEGETLHYIYVSSEQRGQGIAKELLNLKPFDTVSHITRSFERFLKTDTKFNPFK